MINAYIFFSKKLFKKINKVISSDSDQGRLDKQKWGWRTSPASFITTEGKLDTIGREAGWLIAAKCTSPAPGKDTNRKEASPQKNENGVRTGQSAPNKWHTSQKAGSAKGSWWMPWGDFNDINVALSRLFETIRKNVEQYLTWV